MGRQPQSHRFRFATGAALAAIGVSATIALIVVYLLQVAHSVPSPEHTFGNNQGTSVHVDAGVSKSVYFSGNTAARTVNCKIFGNNPSPKPGDVPSLRRYSFDFIPNSRWRARYYFQAKQSDYYRIICSGPADVRYGVGEYVGSDRFTPLFSAMGASVALAMTGLALIFLTAVRRAGT